MKTTIKVLEEEIKFLRIVTDEINKVKIRLTREKHKDTKTWDELYNIKQNLLEMKIAELKRELEDDFLRETKEKLKKQKPIKIIKEGCGTFWNANDGKETY